MSKYKKILISTFIMCLTIFLFIILTSTFNLLGTYIFMISIAVGFNSIILFFVTEKIAKLWLKFTLIFLPFSIIASIFLSGDNATIMPLDKELTFMLLVGLYVTSSLILIAYKSYKLRNK